MISHRDMLGIICTEAIEGELQQPPPERKPSPEPQPSVQYDLRLVRDKNGTVTWQDD